MQLMLRAALGLSSEDFTVAYQALGESEEVVGALSTVTGLSPEQCRAFIADLTRQVDYPFGNLEA